MILTHGPCAPTPDSKDDGQPEARATSANQPHFADRVA